MSLYLFLILYLPLLGLLSANVNVRITSKGLFLFLYFIFILVYRGAGPDHSIYSWVYSVNGQGVDFEPLFLAVVHVVNFFSSDYDIFLVTLKLISLISVSYFIFSQREDRVIFFFLLYLPISFLTFEYNLLRQAFSLHFCLIAATLYSRNKHKSSLFFLFLAVSSHVSAVILMFMYIKKINWILVAVLIMSIVVAYFLLPYLMLKYNAYDESGEIALRFDTFIIQLLVLMVLPFIFFSARNDSLHKVLYLLICLLSFIPVFVRLYPLALVILLPYISTRYQKKSVLLLLFVSSFFIAGAKAYLLIEADKSAIYNGIYAKGYTN
jgi:hypothetical protein